jgi:hypothetical protein
MNVNPNGVPLSRINDLSPLEWRSRERCTGGEFTDTRTPMVQNSYHFMAGWELVRRGPSYPEVRLHFGDVSV